MNYKMIWFDFGGVLSPPINELFDIYQSRTGIPTFVLKDVMKKVAADMGLEMLSPIENALISESEWGSLLRAKLISHYPSIDTSLARLECFGEQWFSNVIPNILMVNEFIRLKELGYSVGILTNNVIEWEPHWKAMLNLSNTPDFIVDSCKERRRKPEPEFFYLAEKQSGFAPDECILIDDLKVNCDAAAQRGWGTVHFRDTDSALTELRTLLESRTSHEYRSAESTQ
ncbi:HAD-IA family hydrolase [Vibrio mimicus]|uniref:HAD-IA family hydrolase n=1 Tax=Vibrio mimicus TaxID=674 RepID=UPI0011D5FC63|nr:HAD-IA family hydrolase [Vibrio mimicus]TXY44908.1 HAD-IA family hydrolase [Vibrio mimicus]